MAVLALKFHQHHHMLKRYTTTLLIAFPVFLLANTQIFPVNTSGDILRLESLFSANMSHSGAETMAVEFRLSLQKSTGQTVFAGRTSTINLKSGLNWVDMTGRIIAQQFPDAQFGQYYNSKQHLPYGNYKACIEVVEKSSKEITTRHCFDVRAGRELSLQLIYPLDDSELKQLHSYSWSGLMVRSDQPLTYSMKVVALRPDQQPDEAIYNNPAHVEIKGHPQAVLPNSPLFKPLQEGTQYAWQVMAFLGRELVATSQTWTFTISSEAKEEKPLGPVPVAKSGKMGNHLTVPDNFRFKTEDKISENVEVLLVDIDQNKTRTLDAEEFMQNGQSFQLGLQDLLGGRKEKNYLVMVQDKNIGRSYFLKLIY